MQRYATVADLVAGGGSVVGPGEWITVAPADVEAFAAATGADAGFAPGLLVVGLLPRLLRATFAVDGVQEVVGYGLNKVRFPAPVTAGGRIRATVLVVAATALGPGAVQVTLRTTVAAEGSTRPVCVAEVVVRYRVSVTS